MATQSRMYQALIGILILILAIIAFQYNNLRQKSAEQRTTINNLTDESVSIAEQLVDLSQQLEQLQQEDQVARNDELESEIDSIQKTYEEAVTTYEDILELKEKDPDDTEEIDELYSQSLSQLAERSYSSASATLETVKSKIDEQQTEIASSFSIPSNVNVNNSPPGSGYSRQQVETSVGSYLVDIISADLNSTRVVVDTASDGTCGNDCPVDSLGSYAARSGAIAGVNGPYFCPASYPSCAGKTNSFDTLLMNKNKVYFNSDNNVYSTVPAVIFSGNSARFVSQSSQWGRDTSVDAVIANQPLLTLNGSRVFGGDGEPKRAGKGSRSFIGTSGNTVYIGVIHNASAAEMAHVLETLGIQNSLNLDSGGSTALWHQGRYIAGPGRNTPFGILLVGK